MNIEQLDKLQATLNGMKEELHILSVQLEALKYIKNSVRKDSDKKTTVKKSSNKDTRTLE